MTSWANSSSAIGFATGSCFWLSCSSWEIVWRTCAMPLLLKRQWGSPLALRKPGIWAAQSTFSLSLSGQ